jgi:hypothetical protein
MRRRISFCPASPALFLRWRGLFLGEVLFLIGVAFRSLGMTGRIRRVVLPLSLGF